jgi:RND family efflux transporter MFP subunit
MTTKSKRLGIGLIVAAAIIVALILLHARKHGPTMAAAPEPSSEPIAPAAKVERANLSRTVVIPAEFRPYVAVQLHAKVSGYLDQMNVDFGDRVKSGQLLITVEVPELHDELVNALGQLQQAEDNYTNAHWIFTRISGVQKQHPDYVAQQDVDTATSKDLAAESAVAAARADAAKYSTLASYTNITAPFDGVVTHRYVDPGALVEAGTASQNTQPLLEVSDNYHLRLDFPVSVDYVKDIHVGDTITGIVQSLNGKTFSGKITRATWRVNDDTRTMITEIEVVNPDLELVPGMYASVAIPVDVHSNALSVPIEAVPPGQTTIMFVVNTQNEIEERSVKLGIDTPTKYEVLSGLKEGELVLTGSRSQFKAGEKVEPKIIENLTFQ